MAFVGADNQLHVRDGRNVRQVTWSTDAGALTSWGGTSEADAASWPCWSPDGRWLVCFHGDPEQGSATGVAFVEAYGVREHRLSPLDERQPIHIQWSPDGERVAILAQFDDELELWVVPADGSQDPQLLAEGSPLFFGWCDGGRGIVLHVGAGDGASGRVEVRDVVGDEDDVVFRVAPGSFCAPFVMTCAGEERVVYVVRRDEDAQLVSARIDGEDILGLGVFSGLLAVIPEPNGQRIACSAAPDADGAPYEGIWVVPVDGSADPQQVLDEPVVAYFWRPTRGDFVWVRWDAGRKLLRVRVRGEDGVPVDVATFRPTRDTWFFFRFFEQFARSHAAVSDCGRWFTWSGYPVGPDLRGPYVWVADLDQPGSPPKVVGQGSFSVFSSPSISRLGAEVAPAGAEVV